MKRKIFLVALFAVIGLSIVLWLERSVLRIRWKLAVGEQFDGKDVKTILLTKNVDLARRGLDTKLLSSDFLISGVKEGINVEIVAWIETNLSAFGNGFEWDWTTEIGNMYSEKLNFPETRIAVFMIIGTMDIPRIEYLKSLLKTNFADTESVNLQAAIAAVIGKKHAEN